MRRAVARLTGLKLAGALLGLAYSASQARLFGATGEMDAYFVAMAGVYMITSLVQGGQLAEVFVPEYLGARHRRSQADASALFSAVVTRLLAAVIALSALAILAAPLIMGVLGPGLSAADGEMATAMFRWAAVMVALTLFASFVNTTLNAEGVFGRAELTGLASQAISLALLWSMHGRLGIWVLIYSQTIGKLIELGSGAWFLRRKGIRFRPAWNAGEHDLGRFFKVLWATSGYVVATQLFTSVVTAAASLLPPGSLSIFNYAKLYCTKASALLLTPLSTVLFSKLAGQAAAGKGDLSRSLTMPVRSTLLLTAIITGMAWLAGRPALALLLGGPTMDTARLDLAHAILTWGFVGVTLSGTGGLFRKAAVALGKARRLYTFWSGAQVLSAAAAYAAVLLMGEQGLVWVMPINMGLLSWVSLEVSRRAGIGPGEALTAAPDGGKWVAMGLAAAGLPWGLAAIPLEPACGEPIAALIRLGVYGVCLGILGWRLWLRRDR